MTVFHPWQQCILLRFVETVDFIDKEDSALIMFLHRSCAVSIAARISFTPESTALIA